jgi:peptide deformylase
VPFDFSAMPPKEVDMLVRKMRSMMKLANGIGLSANQIGLPFAAFVAQVPRADGGVDFFAIFNPKIVETSGRKVPREEGCLSIPETWGKVERYEKVTLQGQDKRGKVITIKASGLLAHIFQHETDHLNGKVFTEKAEELWKTDSSPNS